MISIGNTVREVAFREIDVRCMPSEYFPHKNLSFSEIFSLQNFYLAHDYWVEEDDKLEMMENIEYLCSQYKSDKLSSLNEQLGRFSN